MNMLEAQRRQCKKTFFSEERLGELVTYNDKSVVALVSEGATLSRTDWNASATAIESAAMADLATVTVCDEDIPNPSEGDHILYGDTEYTVVSVINHDKAAAAYSLTCSKNNRGFRTRRRQ